MYLARERQNNELDLWLISLNYLPSQALNPRIFNEITFSFVRQSVDMQTLHRKQIFLCLGCILKHKLPSLEQELDAKFLSE